MPREWTDWALPDSQVSLGEPLLVDAFGLLILADLLRIIDASERA
jgi:hypothetical protein